MDDNLIKGHKTMKASFSLNKLFIFFILFSLFLGSQVLAEPSTKIAIFPLSVITNDPNPQIENNISKMILTKLEQEGAKVILAQAPANFDSWEYPQFRKHGIQLGVDYILTGSVFIAGEAISIDSRLINIYEEKSTSVFYTEAENQENIFNAVSNLSKSIVGELFQKKIITNIRIVGNDRVESDAIMRVLDTQSGDIIKETDITRNLRKIYEMGYFDDVVVTKESLDKGISITFKVVQKPSPSMKHTSEFPK